MGQKLPPSRDTRALEPPLQGQCQVSCLDWGVRSGVEPGVAGWMACPGQMDTKVDLQMLRERGAELLWGLEIRFWYTWVYSPMGVSLKSLFLVSL